MKEPTQTEMLTVPRKKVMELFNEYQELYEETKGKCHDKEVALSASRFYGKMCALGDLFGSKCLPDEDANVPKPNCKHFKDGKCMHPAVSHFENGKLVKGADCDVSSCEDVEYEPKPAEPTSESRNLSQETANCDNPPDNILKDSFSKKRRLNIAVRMMQALVCAPPIPGVDPNPPAKNLARTAFRLADALIAQAEKGGAE